MSIGKRFGVLLMCCAIVLTLFAGCGSGDNPQPQSSQFSSSTQSPETDTPAQPLEKKGPIVVFHPFPYNNVEEDWLKVQAALEEAMADNIALTFDFIVVPTDGMLEKLNVMLAGGEQLDLVVLNPGDADKYMTTPDLMMPLNDLLNEYGKDLLENIPEEAWIRCTNSKGEIMYLPAYRQWRWQGCAIREDLLEEQGLPIPTNIAELENVMETFKNAYPDMIPAVGLPWFSDPFLQGSQDSVASWMTDYALDADGNVVPSRTLPEYKKMIALYKKWVENGWYDAEYMSGNDESHALLWNTGRIGIWFCDPHRALDWNYDSFKQNFPDGKGTFLPIPTNEAGVKKFPISYGVGRVVWIKKDSQYGAEIVQYFNKLMTDPDFYMLATNGVEGEHWVDLGDEWALPEGVSSDKRPYSNLLAILSWEFRDNLKPARRTPRPEVDWVNDALNAEYASAELILTGLEGFMPDQEPVAQYNPIDLDTYLPQVIVTDVSIDEFDNVIQQWYDTGGREIVAEYTRQYNEWLEANK